ncbi:MAG: hypothetical protein SGJ19_02475 [Planctomycetia bacterium]|nr:hypothetical protein [Planctomycetia bacterium]
MQRRYSLFAIMLATLVGCADFDLKKNIPWGAGEDGQLERPMKLVANWSETVMTSGASQPIRGFGGRLVYYANEGGKPVKVAGTLTVYAFNETDGFKDNVVPERKFVFTEEQFAAHYTDKGILKHSYNFWLPFDELGGEQKQVSLLCRFVSAQGDVVLSEQTRHVLPGKPPMNPTVPETLAVDHPALPTRTPPVTQGVQQVGYFDPMPPTTESRARMNTTTIDLGSDMPGGAHGIGLGGLTQSGASEATSLGSPTQSTGSAQFRQTGVTAARLPALPSGETRRLSTRSVPERSRAPRASTSPPERGRGLWQRPRGGWPSAPGAQRSTGPATAGGSSPST